MRLLPLVLTAHASAWEPDGASGGRHARALSSETPCRFCGLLAAGWQEAFHVNGDHEDESIGNVVVSCPLCHLVQHLNRPQIEQEGMLVWLPELSQAAVNAIARHCQFVFHTHGESPAMDRRPRIGTPELRAAYRAYKALEERSAQAVERLGTCSPRELGVALMSLSKEYRERRRELLGGVRLLGRGRLFRGGRDVYPTLLEALRAPHGWRPSRESVR
jgi:intracellular multiplication protein IcmJ